MELQKATEIFAKHWAKRTDLPLDEVTKHHMKYCIEAIQEGIEFGAKCEPEKQYSLQDIIDAVQYGFDYRGNSQNDGKKVPLGNTLQWLMAKKGLVEVPQEFRDAQVK